MFSLYLKSEVYEDIELAYKWYEKQRTGLGEDFLLALEESYFKIQRTPNSYQKIYKKVRRNLVRRFPYGIFFAILHTKRKPQSWIDRS